MVLRPFSPARAWRPAVAARLARTLGITRSPIVKPPAFFAYADELLRREPALSTTWSEDRLTCTIYKTQESGFDIVIAHEPEAKLLSLGTDRGYHDHYHLDTFENETEGFELLMGIVRDLLAPAMRIVEVQAGGKARKWQLQSLIKGEWRTEGSTGLLLWNPLAKRTEVVYTNNTLPLRPISDA